MLQIKYDNPHPVRVFTGQKARSGSKNRHNQCVSAIFVPFASLQVKLEYLSHIFIIRQLQLLQEFL
jgi:hypothetical protein